MENKYIFCTKIPNKYKKIIKKNPHSLEYFVNSKDIYEATNHKCNDNDFLYDKNKDGDKDNIQNYKDNLNKYKEEHNFLENYKEKELKYKYDDIDDKIDYESTIMKPISIVHWGQLKMFLITLIFLIKVVKTTDKIVNIVYAGSARGDNILLLANMFPNTRWYLIDPHPFHKDLFKHKQVMEIINDFFTDDLAKKYHDKFNNSKDKLLFISDIRLETNDESIIKDQEMNGNWHKILNPDYSWLKFRCPYEIKDYEYYDGKIYIQPYAPIKSTETRMLLTKDSKRILINSPEYQAKLFYFNRIKRPRLYPSIINLDKTDLFDHCFDCTYFSYLIKNYIKHFSKFNYFKSKDILYIMNEIIKFLETFSNNKIRKINNQIFKELKI